MQNSSLFLSVDPDPRPVKASVLTQDRNEICFLNTLKGFPLFAGEGHEFGSSVHLLLLNGGVELGRDGHSWRGCPGLVPGQGATHLRCVRKLPLTCPDPSQPGVGHDMPSVLTDFQENCEPLRYPSFCLLAARGHPDALRWEAYFPVMWPWPSHPGTGHLGGRRDTLWGLGAIYLVDSPARSK